MIQLLIVAPIEQYTQNGPRGFSFTEEVFSEARLDDPISKTQNLTKELQRAISYLIKRYPHRIQARYVELWSPGGLWCAFRFKLRSFPAVILNQKEILTGEDLNFQMIVDRITSALSRPQP